MSTLTSSNTDVQVAGLTAADHSLGSADAPVTLLEYGDYECPACAQAEPITRHLVETLGENIGFVFRHFPLVEVHPNAELAAEATEAAAAQSRFWEMRHLRAVSADSCDNSNYSVAGEEDPGAALDLSARCGLTQFSQTVEVTLNCSAHRTIWRWPI